MVIISQPAVALVKLLNQHAWIWGTHREFEHKNETITVILANKRCFLYGEQRKAMVSIARGTIENIENLNEEDVVALLRRTLELQGEMRG